MIGANQQEVMMLRYDMIPEEEEKRLDEPDDMVPSKKNKTDERRKRYKCRQDN